MTDVWVFMKDGTKKTFKHSPRPGGSWDVKVRYEGAFVVVTDEYEQETAIPAADILEIRVMPRR